MDMLHNNNNNICMRIPHQMFRNTWFYHLNHLYLKTYCENTVYDIVYYSVNVSYRVIYSLIFRTKVFFIIFFSPQCNNNKLELHAV